jgi:ribosome-binding factor A
MKSQRQLQIGENIKRVMSEIFLRDDILTIPGSYITILEADVSPDAKNVKIYIDIFGNEKLHDQILKSLNKAAPHFRFELSKRVSLRVAPEIVFALDRTESRAMKIDDLLARESQKFNQKGSKRKK